jgi:RND family efflux transporter MFP subunit
VRPWCWGTAWLVLAACAGCGGPGAAEAPSGEHGAAGEEPHVTVRIVPARLGALTETVEGLGRCEALPDHMATLTPAVEGHVHALLARQGDSVKEGEPLVELDRSVAQADLAEKTATRDGLKASLALLQSLPRPEERRATEMAVEQARVAVDRARAVVDSLEPLRKGGNLVSKQQVYDAEKALEAARFQEQAAEGTLKAMMIGPRPEAVAEARGKIKTADALVDLSRTRLDYHTIRAPISGVLDSLTCHPGQTIAIGSPIGTVVDTRQVFASVWLPSRSASAVRVGQPARVWPQQSSVAAPDASAATREGMAGKVAFVGRVADPQTGNLPVRILVDNPQGRLTIGESVRTAIIVGERADALQVPARAVLDLGEGPVLNVVRAGKSAVLHPAAGTPHDGWVAVSGTDLKAGEPVIVEGGYNLPEATPVKAVEAQAVAQAEAEARP